MAMADEPIETPAPAASHQADEPLPGERRTRLSGAWTAIFVGLVALVVILVFILQNQQSVEVAFLVFKGQLPLAVAILFALILRAVIVLGFWAAPLYQLQIVALCARRKRATSTPPPAESP